MSNEDEDLPFGLYERLVTAGLKARFLGFDSATTRIVTEELDAAEAHATLAQHIANLVAGVRRMTIGTWSRRWSRCPPPTFW
jgi:hypothetical protein